MLPPSVQLRLAVTCPSELSPFAPDASSALPYPISSEYQSSLRLKCCFVISSTPRAPLPRLSVYLFFHVREVCTLLICIPGYRLPVQYQVTRSHDPPPQLVPHHNQSRQQSDAARCRKDEMFPQRHRERIGSISVRNTLRAKAPTEGTENTYRDFTRSDKKR